MNACGIIHPYGKGAEADRHGCLLPKGHSAPHEYISEGGERYQWETDLECDCEHCMQCDGDYCTIYWPMPTTAPNQ